MNQRRTKPSRVLKLTLAAAAWLWLALGVAPTSAQQFTTLIHFTNVWKYDQSGFDLGIAWRTNNYDDSNWPSGRGLLGHEPDTPVVYQRTALINTPLVVSSTVTTFYFRTTFEFIGSTQGLSLFATNLVDDGCAVYLNGQSVGGVRVPASYNATTFFSGPAAEGQFDVLTITNLSLLRQGGNLLAAEVHQASVGNFDIMWGMKLMAIQQTPLAITRQPQSQTVIVGSPATLTVDVSGGPAFYRWEKDGAPQSSTSNSLRIASAQLGHAGNYRVIITNSVNAVTSSVATLAVFPDTIGPKLLAAIINNRPPGGPDPFGSNTINILFDEQLLNPSPAHPNAVRNTNNYHLALFADANIHIPILSAGYSQALGTLLTVDASNPNWIPGGNYVLTVNNLIDQRGNVIAPDSQIAVSRLRVTTNNVPLAENTWCFHTSAIFDPGIYDEPWQATNYVEGPWWAQGQGLFYGGAVQLTPCIGAFRTATGFQPEPSLFRTTFDWPGDWPTSLPLSFRIIYNDGLILYLNGTEIYRANMTTDPVSPFARASSVATVCSTNLVLAVTNLLPGRNWLAAAVVQTAGTTEGNSIFGIDRLSATVTDLIAPSLPELPPPTLALTPFGSNTVRLSWNGGGYALESATNLNLGPASYPFGPWQQVTNMSNPYTTRLDDTQRFYRLKK